jgi:hypothetical protein
MRYWWNDTEKRRPMYLEKSLRQCHFVHPKPHVERSGIEPGPPWWQPSDWTPEPLHGLPRCKKILRQNQIGQPWRVWYTEQADELQSEIWDLRISRQTRTLPLCYVTVFAVYCQSIGNAQHSLNFPKNFCLSWHRLKLCGPQNNVSNRSFVDTSPIKDVVICVTRVDIVPIPVAARY